ncbi:hypothetical protein [Leuconostoc carnosum]|uniref:hypothetical protein n=1 Tax=Leuconostoc carnosum TaxID=1252 RepID=UPI00123A32DB|nr:hypothetical protein [Leuconostoc carnosum]KAA8373876.1 hypothetical protein FE412_02875 [Leuconostoc carnosum]
MKHKSKIITLETSIMLVIILALSIVIGSGYIVQYLMIPVAVIIIVAMITGFFFNSILLLWLVTILFFVGIAIILNIGSQVDSNIKIILLLLFPIFSISSSLLKIKILNRVTLINNHKMIMSKVSKRNIVTKMGTELSFEKYYDKIVSRFSKQEPLIILTLISLPYYEQRVYADQAQLFKKISEISSLLKEHRLPSERLFYIGEGEFIIVSLRVTENELKELNRETREQLKDIYFEYNGEKHEFRYQFASLKLDQEKPRNIVEILKKLHREQETDLIDEYLL